MATGVEYVEQEEPDGRGTKWRKEAVKYCGSRHALGVRVR